MFMDNNENFINAILPAALGLYKKHDILPSLTMAQAVLESNWGNSSPGNNLFGIKWTEGCGFGKELLWTTEYVNGVATKVQDWFRVYSDLSESIKDYGDFLASNSRYKPVLECTNYKDACVEIEACGYATDPNYSEQLIKIIEDNSLNKWDSEVYKMPRFMDVGLAIDFLVAQRVINSPDYWIMAVKITKNLDILIINMANKLSGNL